MRNCPDTDIDPFFVSTFLNISLLKRTSQLRPVFFKVFDYWIQGTNEQVKLKKRHGKMSIFYGQ